MQEEKDRLIAHIFRKKNKLIIICMVFILILGIGTAVGIHIKKSGNDSVQTISKASLEKMIQTSDLYTLEYTYNAITDVNDYKGNPKYHVAYKGTVTVGIDFSKVEVYPDEKNKKIVITIPEAYVKNVDIDMGKMDFIFEDKKYDTETVSQEAYAECKADLKMKAAAEQSLLTMARDNAKDVITALIEPLVQQVDEEYKVEIN